MVASSSVHVNLSYFANAKRNARGHRFQVGTQVLRKNEHRRKTDSLWDPRPWSETSVSGNKVSLQRQGESARCHASLVKPIPDVSQNLGNTFPDSVHVTRSTSDAVSVQNVSRNVHVDCAMQNNSNSLADAGGTVPSLPPSSNNSSLPNASDSSPISVSFPSSPFSSNNSGLPSTSVMGPISVSPPAGSDHPSISVTTSNVPSKPFTPIAARSH